MARYSWAALRAPSEPVFEVAADSTDTCHQPIPGAIEIKALCPEQMILFRAQTLPSTGVHIGCSLFDLSDREVNFFSYRSY